MSGAAQAEADLDELAQLSTLVNNSRAQVAQLDMPATEEELQESRDRALLMIQGKNGVFPTGSSRRADYEAALARQIARDIAQRGAWPQLTPNPNPSPSPSPPIFIHTSTCVMLLNVFLLLSPLVR